MIRLLTKFSQSNALAYNTVKNTSLATTINFMVNKSDTNAKTHFEFKALLNSTHYAFSRKKNQEKF